jgi:predicted transcriptional regulator
VTEYTAIDLEGGPRLTRPVTIASLRSGVPKNKRDRFLVIVRDSEAVRTAVHFSAADDPYLVLLGRDGAARWQYNGAFSHTVLKQLRDRIGAMRE